MVYMIILMASLLNLGDNNPVELGKVKWLRSYDEAISKSKKECKPVLVLFQEVPGCGTCQKYGNEVLSHPLIVEAIETHFIPLAIYNNKTGADAEVLKKYNEPSWNNPVVRIVDDKGVDVVARVSGNYTSFGLVSAMTNALVKSQGKAPEYLQLLADELTAKKSGTQKQTYSMHCFWSGEALFGKTNGVVATTAGWQGGKEVVVVEYNPSLISVTQLDRIAQQLSCKKAGDGSFTIDNTPKYYLSNNKLRNVPMTELQKSRINSLLAEGQNPEHYLSPRQLQFAKISNKENYVTIGLAEAWDKAQRNLKM